MTSKLVTFIGDEEKIRIALRRHNAKLQREGFSFSLRNAAEQTARLAQALQRRNPSRLHTHLAFSAEEILLRIARAFARLI